MKYLQVLITRLMDTESPLSENACTIHRYESQILMVPLTNCMISGLTANGWMVQDAKIVDRSDICLRMPLGTSEINYIRDGA